MHQKAISLVDLSESVAKLELENEYALDGDMPALAKLESDLNRNVRSTALTPKLVAITEPLPAAQHTATINISGAQKNAILGDLLLHTGELVRSETFLRRTLAEESDQPLATASLGILLVRQEKTADAKAYLEKAIGLGSNNPLVLTGYAYALIQEHSKEGGVSEIPDDAAKTIRADLKRSIAVAPFLTESYRLLAMLYFIRDENLDEAISLLQKALTQKNGDANVRILLARILLRCEEVGRARQLAEQISATSSDAKQKAEADEIVKAAFEYTQTKAAAEAPMRLNVTLGERDGLVILKRSWMTDADVNRIDDERINNNLNRIIIRPVSGEQQLVGRIEKISCFGSSIFYRVRAADKLVIFTSNDFAGIRMTVATEGEKTFQIGCGASLGEQMAVVNYRPVRAPTANKTLGELDAISFVPDNFRLKTVEEMASARLVTIDDDTLRRSGPSPIINDETIARSISQSLRKPKKGEDRVVGTIEKVECLTATTIFNVRSGGRPYKFIHASGQVELSRFTVASSQLSVRCGSGPIAATTILTFLRSNRSNGVDGELKAIEFVPDGFVP
jgi:Flp pilus assembly protein TadD